MRHRYRQLAAGLALLALVAGCGFDRDLFIVTQADVEAQTPFVTVPSSQAWINPPSTSLVMQRGLLGGSEQRIALPNQVPMPGDNLVVLRSRTGSAGNGRLRFEELMTRLGGAPAPFTDLRAGDLRSGEDQHGTYFWAEQLAGADITCVLGLRRITFTMRPLPGDATAMDVMLRNCVHGTAAEALAPMLDGSVGVRKTAGDGQGSTLMMSPLAAPGVQ